MNVRMKTTLRTASCRALYRLAGAFCLCTVLAASCSRSYVPRPYGYPRLQVPDTSYTFFAGKGLPYAFDLSGNAAVVYKDEPGEKYWLDIVYPSIGARIYCSYKPVAGNLAALSDDAQKFVYRHASRADAIPERGFEHPEKRVYGVLYELYGNTASPIQFVLTDSTEHFFRGALYFNCEPNQDSIAPMLDYMREDIVRLMESFEWR